MNGRLRKGYVGKTGTPEISLWYKPEKMYIRLL